MDQPVDPRMWGGEERRADAAGALSSYQGLLTARQMLGYLLEELPRLGLGSCLPLLEATEQAVEDALEHFEGPAG